MNGGKMKKAFLAFGVAGTLAFCVPTMPVKAISSENIQTNTTVQPIAEGLIYKYTLSISASNGELIINGSTMSSDTMKSIGFKDIEIECSSDRANWSTETSLSDKLSSSSSEYRLTNHSVDVDGGYYYRVTCKHYAKESGLFGSSQSIDNTSNVVYIS